MANEFTGTPLTMQQSQQQQQQRTPLHQQQLFQQTPQHQQPYPQQQIQQQPPLLMSTNNTGTLNTNNSMVGGLGMTTPMSSSHMMQPMQHQFHQQQPQQPAPPLSATQQTVSAAAASSSLQQQFTPMQSHSHQRLQHQNQQQQPIQSSIQPSMQQQPFQQIPSEPMTMASNPSKMQSPVMQSSLVDTPGQQQQQQQQPLINGETMATNNNNSINNNNMSAVNGGVNAEVTQPSAAPFGQLFKSSSTSKVVASSTVHSSLVLQIVLHFDEYFAMFFMVGGSINLIVKAGIKQTSGYPPLSGIADFVMLCLMTIVQIARLTLASKGNKCVDYIPLIYAALLSLPTAMAYIFFLDWQSVILVFDTILCSIGLALLSADTILSLLVALSFWSLQRKQD